MSYARHDAPQMGVGYAKIPPFIQEYALLTTPLRQLTGQNVTFRWGYEESTSFQKLKDRITNEETMAFLTRENQSWLDLD